MQWRVTHSFEGGANVETRVDGYPALGVTFEYDDKGLLTSVVHTLEIGDDLHAADASQESEVRLRSLWAMLEFLRGGPLPRRSATARRVQTSGTPTLEAHGTMRLAASAVLVRQIRFPSEAAAISANARLHELANGARDDDDAAHALRDYYSILEALSAAIPVELKHVRDFLSHGGPLGNPDLLAYVRGETRDPNVDRYDPANPSHKQLVSRWRSEAGRLVDRALQDRLR